MLLGFSTEVPFLDCNKYITGSREKFPVLIIVSVTVAAILLTITPEDNRVKQFSFLLIAVAGVVAAGVAIEPQA